MPDPSTHVTTPQTRVAGLTWDEQWARVPTQWRQLHYRIDEAPQVFIHNARYLNDPAGHDFTPAAVPRRICDELAWWVWLCGDEGVRKFEPSLLKWCGQALTDAVADYQREHGRAPASVTDLSAQDLLRCALVGFERRNGRLPGTTSRRNIIHLIERFHLYVSVRCTDVPWWQHDIWDLHADPRIPQREHEPRHDLFVAVGLIQPGWLREGVRFWLRTALSTELLRWSSVVGRARTLARHLGPFLTQHQITDPAISADPSVLRQVFTDFSGYLRSPAASSRPGQPLSASAIDAVQSQTQVFYTFMADHAPDAAAATSDQRWAQLGDAHTLNRPGFVGGSRTCEGWRAWQHHASTVRNSRSGLPEWRWMRDGTRSPRAARSSGLPISLGCIPRRCATGFVRLRSTAVCGRAPPPRMPTGSRSWSGRTASCGGRTRS